MAGHRRTRSRSRRRVVPAVLVLAAFGLVGPAAPALVPAAAVAPVGTPVTAPAPSPDAVEPEEPVAHLPGVGVVPRVLTVPVAVTGAPAGPSDAPPAADADETPRTQVAATPRPAATPAEVRLPLGASPPGTQAVTVVAPSSGATTAELTAWELGPSGWAVVLGPVRARIGSSGVGTASENSTRTPAGTFGLTEAFGRAGDPGTALPYRVVDGDDWWVSDVASPRYNEYAQCAPGTCDFDETVSEDLAAAGAVYDHAVVIDVNRAGRPGAGSAFFLHVANGAPTAGCVAIDRGSLATLLRWLDPSASPVIAIGVG
jgi:L,D-peptidoglycan transpeptidase YkuD (ErfK/YbiS/YcfS/YnhG family)